MVEMKRLKQSVSEQTDMENGVAQAAKATAYAEFLMMDAGYSTGEEEEAAGKEATAND
jgi:hypothetical protein